MPKVIGKSNAHVHTCTCRNCASVIEYTMNETLEDYSSDYTGDRDYYRYINCPGCGKRVVTRNF